MRTSHLLMLSAVLLMGCNSAVAQNTASSTQASPPPAEAPVLSLGPNCKTDGYETRRVLADGEALKPGSNDIDPKTLPKGARVIAPGQPVTMDYSPQRLNLEINDKRIVIKAKCG
jgi:hypothetical protein